MPSLKDELRFKRIAMEMIARGARVPVVKSLSPLDIKTITYLHEEITGKGSPKGPLPSDPSWFTSSMVPWRNIQTSFFVSMYQAISKKSSDAFEAEVLIEAYDIYIRHCELQNREPSLNINRCWSLMRMIKTNELMLTQCTTCDTRIVTLSFTLQMGYVCCLCNRIRSLKPKFWDKATQISA